jgi:hypothetical protein
VTKGAPAVVFDTWLGLRFFYRIDDKCFRQIVLLFLLIAGATLIAR